MKTSKLKGRRAHIWKQPWHLTSMKNELGLWTRRFSLCERFSSSAGGCRRSMSACRTCKCARAVSSVARDSLMRGSASAQRSLAARTIALDVLRRLERTERGPARALGALLGHRNSPVGVSLGVGR